MHTKVEMNCLKMQAPLDLHICLYKANLFTIEILYFLRYASLYFVVATEPNDNELITLECIHRYVELLDKYFGNVCF